MSPKPDSVSELKAAVAAFPGTGFAVLDGGQFDDLPALLGREGLFARSLFLDHADREVEKAGPWLVSLGQKPDAADTVLRLVGARPVAVFWSCAGGEPALHRHLRTLNRARIPDWAAKGAPGPADPEAPAAYESVMFRHWDPRVLAGLMPVLDDDQFARVLGPAEEIAFIAEDYGGLARVVAGPGMPPPARGMLTIRAEQIAELGSRRTTVRYRRMMAYLRATAPTETSALSDHDLYELVLRYEASGQRAGLTEERSLGIWCFLMLSSQEQFEHLPKVRAYLRSGPGTPDENVEALLGQMVRLADTDAEVA